MNEGTFNRDGQKDIPKTVRLPTPLPRHPKSSRFVFNDEHKTILYDVFSVKLIWKMEVVSAQTDKKATLFFEINDTTFELPYTNHIDRDKDYGKLDEQRRQNAS